jgi:hypothetical protein
MAMDEQAYHADRTAVSKSWLDKLARSPAHLRYYLDHDQGEQTPAQVLGSALHCAVLEPDQYHSRYKIAPLDRRTKAGKSAWKELQRAAELYGTRIITAAQAHEIEAMKAGVMAHQKAAAILSADSTAMESTLFWTDEDTGVRCKCRPDIIHRQIVCDLKTTRDASRAAFAKAIYNYRYHVQAAFYMDGCRANGLDPGYWLFIAVENQAPHMAAVYELDPADVELGREIYKSDLETYRQCVERDEWPGYADGISTISLPRWAHNHGE